MRIRIEAWALVGSWPLLLGACASGPKIAHRQAPKPPMSATKATVYVLRPNASPVFLNFPVNFDRKPAAILPNRTYTWFQTTPGAHLVEFRDSYMPAVPHLKQAVHLEAGKTYYYTYSLDAAGTEYPSLVPIGNGMVFVRAGGPVVDAAIGVLFPEQAKELLPKLSYVAPTP